MSERVCDYPISYWYDSDETWNCVLPEGHDPPHCDDMGRWFDDDKELEECSSYFEYNPCELYEGHKGQHGEKRHENNSLKGTDESEQQETLAPS